MFRRFCIWVYIAMGLSTFLIILAFVSLGLGIVEEPKATILADYLIFPSGVCFALFIVAQWNIECDYCHKRLISFREGGQATSWNNLLWAWLTKRRVLCPRCKRPNNLRKIN